MAKKDKTAQAERLPSEKALRSLLRLSEQTKSKTGDLAGSMSQAVRDAVERQNLNPRAFRMVAALKRMDPVKLRGVLDHFDAYRDMVKLDDLKASDMFEEDQAPARKAARSKKKAAAEKAEPKAPAGSAHADDDEDDGKAEGTRLQ